MLLLLLLSVTTSLSVCLKTGPVCTVYNVCAVYNVCSVYNVCTVYMYLSNSEADIVTFSTGFIVSVETQQSVLPVMKVSVSTKSCT